MSAERWDRSGQDVGNIIALEHVNVRVPSQELATLFYVEGLGLTRDPYLMVGTDNMWINVGQQQFHLPTGDPLRLRGTVGLVLPDLDALVARLAGVKGQLAGTRFAYAAEDGAVTVTCPWGNRLRCQAPAGGPNAMRLGMPWVEFPVPRGAAAGIARFYQEALGAPASMTIAAGGPVARVTVGPGQAFLFRETAEALPPYDGHHVAIYIADFSRPYRFLAERGLVTVETSEYEWRFQDIVDPATGAVLFTIEHEVRSATHPMYLRPLVNRNPAQRQRTYVRGRDAFVP